MPSFSSILVMVSEKIFSSPLPEANSLAKDTPKHTDQRTLGLSDPRTKGPPDYRILGLKGPRTIGPSDYRAPGLSVPRTTGPTP